MNEAREYLWKFNLVLWCQLCVKQSTINEDAQSRNKPLIYMHLQ